MMFGGFVKGIKKGMLANEVRGILLKNYRLSAHPDGIAFYTDRFAEYYNAHELAAYYIAEEQLANMVKGNSAHMTMAYQYARTARDALSAGAISQTIFENVESKLKALGLNVRDIS